MRPVAVLPHRVEHVDGQALEGAVHTTQPEDRVLVAGGLEQHHLLAELADLRAHVLGELHRDLDVTGLVPALARHVELQLERRLVATAARVEVPARAARALEGLDLAHEDAVHEAPRAVG